MSHCSGKNCDIQLASLLVALYLGISLTEEEKEVFA